MDSCDLFTHIIGANEDIWRHSAKTERYLTTQNTAKYATSDIFWDLV